MILLSFCSQYLGPHDMQVLTLLLLLLLLLTLMLPLLPLLLLLLLIIISLFLQAVKTNLRSFFEHGEGSQCGITSLYFMDKGPQGPQAAPPAPPELLLGSETITETIMVIDLLLLFQQESS